MQNKIVSNFSFIMKMISAKDVGGPVVFKPSVKDSVGGEEKNVFWENIFLLGYCQKSNARLI